MGGDWPRLGLPTGGNESTVPELAESRPCDGSGLEGRPWQETCHQSPTPLCLPSQCVYGGVLRGTGKQAFGAIVNAIMYYVLGLPLGIVLTFVVRMRIMGMCCQGKSEQAWGPSDALSPWLLVSRRPLAGHAGLWPPGRCCLCCLHRPDGLEACSRGGERAVGPGLAKCAD